MSEHLELAVPVLGERALEDRVSRDKPVTVLFYADWCPFCQAFVPTFNEQAGQLATQAVAANVSHPEDPRWEAYGVEAVPTIVAFREGEEIARQDGVPGEGLESKHMEAFGARLEDALDEA